MKKVLICDLNPYGDGYYIQEVRDEEFQVAPPHWFWVDCSDDTVETTRNWYNPATGQFPVRPEVLEREAAIEAAQQEMLNAESENLEGDV